MFNPNVNVKISGTVKGYDNIKINDCSLTAKNLDCADSGTLEISGYKNTLPQLSNMADIVLDENNKVICKQQIQAHTLTLKRGSEFVAYSGVAVDSLAGPGTLCIKPGDLTVHYEVTDLPVLIFSSPVGKGTVAFRSDGNFLSTSAVRIYGYDLTETASGVYRLNFSGSTGLVLSAHNISLGNKGSATITASTSPGLAKYAEGTKIVWEIHGDTSGINMSASNQTCSISAAASATGSHKAVIVAYLIDRNGTYLDGYRADSCIVTQSSENSSTTGLGKKFLSDTTAPLSVNGSYLFKITSLDGKTPSIAVGTAGVFDVTLVKQTGSDFYFKLTAFGTPGTDAGIYIDGGTRLLVATVKQSAPSAICDTLYPFSVESGKSYVFKITAQSSPVFVGGTSGVFRLKYLNRNGNNYYYRITAVGKRGASCGFYLNGSKRPVCVATIR